ncbi:MAG: toxin-antitoxin system HicB family antitoxin [Candidatus Lokiarchaeota archaeon]|nr:toxin-antitoxin system HicB family antitoxin [Candidatus Lokiarchaeota archaeon]
MIKHLTLDGKLHKRIRIEAAKQEKTMKDFVSEILIKEIKNSEEENNVKKKEKRSG